MIISIIAAGFVLLLEKWIFNKYDISASKLVLMEGLLAFTIMIPLIIVAQYIPCPWENNTMCVEVNGSFYF